MKKYDNFCKALKNLSEISKIEKPYNIVEQTGITALFTLCFEQSWKLMKELMEKDGLFENKIGSPRMIIKLAFKSSMINDEESWLEMLETRNTLAHIYSGDLSLTAISSIENKYIPLFKKLKNDIDENWISHTDS